MPTVSVVIPAYNEEQHVAGAVRSALAQTVADLEVVVVDDGSQDATAARVTAIDDPRVRLVRQPNAGLSAARNTGIAHATGEWVAFLDSDDRWAPEKLAAQLACADRHPDAGMIYSAAVMVGPDGAVRWHVPARVRGDVLADLLLGNSIAGSASSAMVRRAVLARVGDFRPELRSAEDWDMWLRVAACARVEAVPEEHVHLLVRSGSMSKNVDRMLEYSLRVLDDAFAAHAAHLRHLRPRALVEAYYRAAIDFEAVGDDASARRMLVRILRRRPGYANAYKRLARNLQRLVRRRGGGPAAGR